MELRQLRHFVAVAEEGNISRAAQKIFLTQPALSRQIKALEEEIGQCLLERSAHSMRLTPMGETLLREARQLLDHADRMLERVRGTGRGTHLRVGYAPSLASGVLSVAMENFAQRHATARVELFDLSTAEMLARLESDKLEVALTVGEDGKTRGITWTPLVRSPWKLAVPRKHPLARQARVTPGDVAKESMLIYGRHEYPEYWEIIAGWLRKHRLRPQITEEYDGAESLLAAVEAGLGVALVTTRTSQRFPGRVRFRSLTSTPEPLCVAAAYRTTNEKSKPLLAFVEELRLAARALT